MSRAYRIRVRESLNRSLQAEDRISTQLELLEVLPAEQMGELLARELEGQGFRKEGAVMVRDRDGVTTTVDPLTGTVTVEAKAGEQVTLEGQREGTAFDDVGPGQKRVQEELRQQLQSDLEKQARQEQARLQAQATGRLEGHLCDLEPELNQAVNRATAAALKQKAAQIGRIKEMTEDPQTGSLTIKLEV
jgi:FtsH ternary system domain X5